MRDLLLQLLQRRDLTLEQSRQAFDAIMSGSADATQVTALLMALAMKGATAAELSGAAGAMREKSIRVDVPLGMDVLDTCGTGGDVKHTFNISTAAAIVIASCGVPVVKHGNRSASSKSGSADVLEALGVKLELSPEAMTNCLREAGICFAFARSHHPAMKHVAPIRQALGVPTIFNLLGPLTNPGRAKRQLLGVFKPELTRLMAEVLLQLGSERAWVAHGEDGLDELSTMAPTRITELKDGALSDWTLDATSLGIARARVEDLQVASAAESAAAIGEVFAGKAGPRSDIVRLNAAAGLVIAGQSPDLPSALAQVGESLAAGKPRAVLERLVRWSNA
jgi:anthranilate phosphoribosyltransferase